MFRGWETNIVAARGFAEWRKPNPGPAEGKTISKEDNYRAEPFKAEELGALPTSRCGKE